MLRPKLSKLNKVLKKFKLSKEVTKYVKNIIIYITDHNINILDINMKSIYNELSINEKYKSAIAIETEIRRELISSYRKVGGVIYEDILKYKNRPTSKKFIILLLNYINNM